MWTLTTPRSGFDCDGLDLEHLGLAEQRVAVEDRARGALSSSVARLAIALPETSETRHAERERVDERPDDDVAALLGLRRVDVVDVQRVVVHRDQAEEVVVGLGHRLGGPVLVDGADLELLEVAAVGVGAGGLAGGLVGLDAVVVSLMVFLIVLLSQCAAMTANVPSSRRPVHRVDSPGTIARRADRTTRRPMRNPRDFVKPLAVGAPDPPREIPFKPRG